MTSCTVYSFVDNKNYQGEYSIEYNKLEVDIYDYPHFFGNDLSEGKYESLLIIDERNKSYLMSNHFYYAGSTIGIKSFEKRRTSYFIRTGKYEDVELLKNELSIKAFKIYHSSLVHCFHNPSFQSEPTKDQIIYRLVNQPTGNKIDININNIESIEFTGEYKSAGHNGNQNIEINIENYIRITLTEPVDCDDLLNYIKESEVFINAYIPTQKRAHKIHVITIDNHCYELTHKDIGADTYEKFPHKPVKMNFFEFFEKMYKEIDYRNTANRNKLIPLDFLKPTALEDKYIYYFRYIDLYMGEILKAQGKKSSNFYCISEFVDKYINYFTTKDIANIDDFKNEINSLRNHYIHEGYYMQNNEFPVTEKNQFKYNKTMDYQWLCRVTDALKQGVYNILYTQVLKVNVNETELRYAFNL